MSFLVNSLSTNEFICDTFWEVEGSPWVCAVERSNRVSRPATVGRKNGAFSGAFGGSLGLLRAYICVSRVGIANVRRTRMVSRFSSVCHFDRGIRDRVNRPSVS